MSGLFRSGGYRKRTTGNGSVRALVRENLRRAEFDMRLTPEQCRRIAARAIEIGLIKPAKP